MRGRKPIPTALKLLAGNPGKRKLGIEPKPRAGKVIMPAHLDDVAKKEWKRITAILSPIGLLTPADRAALAGYCVEWSRWVAAEEVLKTAGLVLKGENGFYQNPYLAVANKALEMLHKFEIEFGLTPSSRVRLSMPAANKERDEFEDFLSSKVS